MSYPRTPTTTTSAATTTPNATPNEPYDVSPATPTDSATPSVSTPSKPPNSRKRCFTHRYFRTSWFNIGWLGSTPAYRSGVVTPRSRTLPVPQPTSRTAGGKSPLCDATAPRRVPVISSEAGCNWSYAVARLSYGCLLYTSDAADDLLCVDLGG